MKNILTKIKLNVIIVFSLAFLALQCASTPSYDMLTKDIERDCYPHASYKIDEHTYQKVNVSMAHYKSCLDYKDVLVVRWDKYNTTTIRVFVNQTMKQYLESVNMKAKLVQWEQWGDGFYIVYELGKD